MDNTSLYGRLLLPIFLPSFFTAVAQQAVLILLPLYALKLGGGAAFAATVLGLRGVGHLAMNVPAGFLVSRFGDKAVMLSSTGMLAVASFTLAVAEQIWVIGAMAVVFGMGMGAWVLARQSYITDLCVMTERGRAMASMGALQRVGALLGPVSGGAIAQFVGFEVAFFAAALLIVIATVLVVFFTKNLRPAVVQRLAGVGVFKKVFAAHRRVFATAGVAAFTLNFMRAGRLLLIPLWGTLIGLDAATIGLIYSLASALDLSLFYAAGLLMDRRGRRWAAVPCMALLALALALLPFTDSFLSLLGVAAIAGVGNGLGTGVVLTLGSDLAPAAQRGEFLGVWRLLVDSGGAGGPFMIGAIGEFATLGAAAFVTAGLGVLGVLMMVVVVEETLTREPQ